ncbi:MAG: copper chaperone PCu(A)C, partial [Gammaproteobacteria bacterium]
MRGWWACLLATITSPAFGCHGLVLDSGWVREPPPQAEVAAAFMVLHNTGPDELRISKISSRLFAASELHETIMRGAHAHMAPRDAVILAPGA